MCMLVKDRPNSTTSAVAIARAVRTTVSSQGEASSSSDLEEVPLFLHDEVIVDHADINVG